MTHYDYILLMCLCHLTFQPLDLQVSLNLDPKEFPLPSPFMMMWEAGSLGPILKIFADMSLPTLPTDRNKGLPVSTPHAKVNHVFMYIVACCLRTANNHLSKK